MLRCGVVPLHDNVRPHTAARTRTLQELFNRELFDHPHYIPDHARSGYHLFIYLKNRLGSQLFNNRLMEVVKT
jgi:hypothetical protein